MTMLSPSPALPDFAPGRPPGCRPASCGERAAACAFGQRGLKNALSLPASATSNCPGLALRLASAMAKPARPSGNAEPAV